jgi:5-methylcytosine-specific restriction protein B
MARQLIDNEYRGHGTSIQFHPNTTYEDFVGGLFPMPTKGELGLQFRPQHGALMRAAAEASKSSRDYLLHIDEINRADLGKVLGEAIYLLEPNDDRTIELAYEFGDGNETSRTFGLPRNLHIVGTMNTADRSLAVVDVAVRRRFSFVPLWPQLSAVEDAGGSALLVDAFVRLQQIFIEHASDDAFNLMPGHSYFLPTDGMALAQQLAVTVQPLLEEYLSQGYVGGFAESVRAYLQWLESLDSAAR